MKKEFLPKQHNIKKDLDGISLRSTEEHTKLYEGYVKKTNEIQKKIRETNKSEANAVYSEIGEMKRQETFAVNGMKLHEVFFANLGGDGMPKGIILEMIREDFGSFDLWKEDFIATGMSSRGWAILAFDFTDDTLRNYGMDSQNLGAVWNASPLLAMDMYEHAFLLTTAQIKKRILNRSSKI